MLTRRALIGAGMAAMAATPSLARARLGDDGLYQLDWYLESFLDLSEDVETATHNGKRLAILWGLKGCPGCRRMHEVHLADPAIESYIHANFEILHLNHIGAREVTDFDGKKFSEKSLGEAYGVRFTPTILFFPESPPGSRSASRRRARWRAWPACSSRRNSSQCSAMCARRATRPRPSRIGSSVSRRDWRSLHPAGGYLLTGNSGSNR